MSNETKSDREYNTTLIALWETKNGNALSMKVDARSFDQLQKAFDKVQVGGKLIVKKLTEEARAKFENQDTAPHYFLEYISKDNVAAYEKQNPRSHSRSSL